VAQAEAEKDQLQAMQVENKTIAASFGEERAGWLAAATDEWQGLIDSGTLREISQEQLRELRRTSTHVDVLPGKVVCTTKHKGDGLDRRKKVRLTVCGNLAAEQDLPCSTHNIDAASMRVLLALAAGFGFWVGALDITAAFLNANLPPSAWPTVLRSPSLMSSLGVTEPGALAFVQKALYGLKASPRAWAKHRDRLVKECTWQDPYDSSIWLVVKQSEIDPSIWAIVEKETLAVRGYFGVYVDDYLVAAPRPILDSFFAQIQGMWKTGKVEVIGPEGGSLVFLSQKLTYDKGIMTITQESYVETVLKNFGLAECRPSKTPCEANEKEDGAEVVGTAEEITTAQKMVGSIIWISTHSRPDVSYATSRAAATIKRNPVLAAQRAKRILRYLSGTKTFGLRYEPFQDADYIPTKNADVVENALESRALDEDRPTHQRLQVRTFGDASFAPAGKESHGGACCFVGRSLVAWRSSRQTLITESTAESELVAMAQCSVIGGGIVALIQSLFIDAMNNNYSDNRAALSIIGGTCGWKSRHFSIKGAALRQRVARGEETLSHKGTRDQTADVMTKALPIELLALMRRLMNMVDDGASPNDYDENEADLDESYLIASESNPLMAMRIGFPNEAAQFSSIEEEFDDLDGAEQLEQSVEIDSRSAFSFIKALTAVITAFHQPPMQKSYEEEAPFKKKKKFRQAEEDDDVEGDNDAQKEKTPKPLEMTTTTFECDCSSTAAAAAATSAVTTAAMIFGGHKLRQRCCHRRRPVAATLVAEAANQSQCSYNRVQGRFHYLGTHNNDAMQHYGIPYPRQRSDEVDDE